jgi:tetratricopeptide (TPR) repeat protein
MFIKNLIICMKMNSRILRNFAVIMAIVVISVANLYGQDRNDVIKAYNEGAKATQTDVKAAIAAFENVITLADKVGETASDLKQQAIKVLPGLYVKVASSAASEKKPATEIIKAAKAAQVIADKYANATAKENAGKVLVQGYYAMGTDFFTKKDYPNAVLAFDSLLAINPGFNTAIFNKALIYKSQNNIASFEQTIDAYIEKMKAANDADKTKQASTMALEYFRAAGSKANQANNLDEAMNLLTKATKYGDDKDLFYYMADVYNKQKNFDSGATYAQKGLDLETGAPEAKAKFYFQLAMAQAGKGQTAEACATFKNSMFGPFAEPSKVQRNNLKCK